MSKAVVDAAVDKVVGKHAEVAPWSDRNEYSNCIGPYKKLYNVLNPANHNYADSGNNYRQAYTNLCRDGMTQRLYKRAVHWWEYDQTGRQEVFHEERYNGEQSTFIPHIRPPLYTDPLDTIHWCMPVFVIATLAGDSTSRYGVLLGPELREARWARIRCARRSG